jgi:Beta-galactosidase
MIAALGRPSKRQPASPQTPGEAGTVDIVIRLVSKLMTRRQGLVRLLLVVLIGFTALSCQASVPPEIGMTVHFRGADGALVKRQFDLMAAMNVTWVRMDLDWSAVESERGQFDWAYPDKIVDEALARRMKVLAVLAYTPTWARSSAISDSTIASHSRPDHLSDYASFVGLREFLSTTAEISPLFDGVGSSQRRNTDGLFEASSAVNRSAGQRSWRTLRGRRLSSCSTASR